MTDKTQEGELTQEEALNFFQTATVEEIGKRYRQFYDMLPPNAGLMDADTCLKMLAAVPLLLVEMREKGLDAEWSIAVDNMARIIFIAANAAYYAEKEVNNG